MPIYEFVCDKCNIEREAQRSMSEAGLEEICSCGSLMKRKFSPISFFFIESGRDRVLNTLNQEDGAHDFPGSGKHRVRYEQAMAKGLNPPRPVIGRGFGG